MGIYSADIESVPAYLAIEISKKPIDQILQVINDNMVVTKSILGAQDSLSIALGNMTLGQNSSAILYNVTCTLQNISDISLNTTFDSVMNNIIVNVNNVSGLCAGRYHYALSIFGNNQTLDDTWNITINQTTLSVLVGLRTQTDLNTTGFN